MRMRNMNYGLSQESVISMWAVDHKQDYQLEWPNMGNLPGHSFAYKRDTDTSNIGPSPNLAQCKVHVHRPWALFRKGTVV